MDSTERSVLLLELCYSALEVGKLSLSAIARVLCGDAIAVCTSLLAVL